MNSEKLWDLERRLWLGGRAVYEQCLAPDSLMVFPSPAGVLDRPATLAAIEAAPRRKTLSMRDRRIATPLAQVILLVYEADADRGEGQDRYRAQCSSTYILCDGDWKLALHQQTPILSDDPKA